MATEGVITRFAPSPTGYLHIGGARTALFNWLFTRRRGGKFILRIEDTDQLRSTEASTRAILDAMTWLGLNWDEGPYFQAGRVDIHREMVQRMIREGKAYCCNCTPEALEDKRKKALAQGRKPKYDGTCRDKGLSRTPDAAVRFRCPDVGLTVLDDLIKGRITFSNDELDDLIIERSDGYPTYNFAVVVDDAQMHITHVIRGDDHVNNTPKQILLYEALGFPVPQFGHVPMILGADRARLSKRHGATSVMAYREMGYLPDALVNYLVRLGWSHGDQEIFDREELGRLFSLDAVGKSAAIFNPEKLLWLNQHYLKISPADRLYPEMTVHWNQRQIVPPSREYAEDVIRSLQSRSRTLVDMAEAGRFYFQQEVTYDPAAAEAFLRPEYAQTLASFGERLSGLADCTKEAVEALLRAVAEERGVKMKFVAQPLRVALTGGTVSPGIDEVVAILGRERVMERIGRAVEFIGRVAVAGTP